MQPGMHRIEQLERENQDKIQSLRQQAQAHRDRADQYHQAEKGTQAQDEEAQALALEQKITDLEHAFTGILAEKEAAQQSLARLEQKKADITRTYQQQIAQIDKEISALRS